MPLTVQFMYIFIFIPGLYTFLLATGDHCRIKEKEQQQLKKQQTNRRAKNKLTFMFKVCIIVSAFDFGYGSITR